MEKYSFKKLYKELVKHFGSDNVEFTDVNGAKTIYFGKKIYPEKETSKERVFIINNDCGYNFYSYRRYGNQIHRDYDRKENFSWLAASIIENINVYKEKNDNFITEQIKMERTTDNDEEELINCLIALKFENKFEEFYDIIKYYYFDKYDIGLSGFRISYNKDNEEELNSDFKKKMGLVYRNYELDNKKDFIKEFGIDIVELSDAICKIMYDEHTDKKFEHYKFFVLRSAERIGEIIANE